ncbi:lytic transglycosylase domain-containing protein [Anaeromyxobacter oryzae]|uniref:Lytic transglycosylase n=1 Tax=Anaeromyxobacter oryzae TaxID=2918170 RepID=A0ABM7WSI3_9BACT|nr:transglycosylase SLT domain-containing protein [Anaeromyxobacter oryzae]BDG02440.1 lytic transglycosylase [Anaeromyxobacter oryzae]
MFAPRALLTLVVAGLLVSARAARAGELYSYVDDDGVMHFSNAPTDARYRKLGKKATAGGVYRATAQARALPLPRAGAQDRYVEHIRAAAAKYRIPEALLLAVMAVESNFDHRAVSEKGAVGLMQLMPGTAKDMYVADAYEPAQNIEGGARYLRILANMYDGDLVRTLAAYNAGPDAVRRAGGEVPDIPETREYVRKVVALYEAYKAGR